jgi:hypothetical protein
MTCVYVDECGFTAGNLLDKAQPVFVLASHVVDEEECAAVRAKYFREIGLRSSSPRCFADETKSTAPPWIPERIPHAPSCSRHDCA